MAQYDRDADALKVIRVDPSGTKIDAARTIKAFGVTFAATVAEAMITLTPVTDGVAGGTATTFAVTAGKRLKLTGMSITTNNAGAAGQGVVVTLRISNSGAVTTATPIAVTLGAGSPQAIANSVGSDSIPLDIELSGAMQLGISQSGTATGGNRVTLWGHEY